MENLLKFRAPVMGNLLSGWIIALSLGLLAPDALAQPAAGAPAWVAGKVVFVTGQVTVDQVAAQKDQAILEGQELRSGPGGTLYLKTVDNGFLVLRPNSAVKIVSYRVDPANPDATQVKYELLQGAARHVSGDAVNKSPRGYRFNTPLAAIGVRGTDFTVYADSEVVRVNVASGGIVVSGFGPDCSSSGIGPCVNANSRELFAGDVNAVLQLRRGQAGPELMRSRELLPDTVAPPRQDEPVRPLRSSGPTDDVSTVVTNEKSSLITAVISAAAPLPPVESVVPVVPDAPVAPVVPPAAPMAQFVWGRWQALADLPASEAKMALAGSSSYLPATVVGPYFLSRLGASDGAMPKEGVFGFRLTGGEAYIVGAGDRSTAAALQNPLLEIDFSKRQFVTSLQVVGAGLNVDVRAQGDLTLQGELVGDIVRSNATVRGYTGGSNASEASYVFSRPIDASTKAVGATSWAR